MRSSETKTLNSSHSEYYAIFPAICNINSWYVVKAFTIHDWSCTQCFGFWWPSSIMWGDIFLYENKRILIHISPKFIPMAQVTIHYCDVIICRIASQITSLTIVYSTIYSDADQRKHQSSASLAFVWGIHRGPVNSPCKWPVTRKMFPFDDVIMFTFGSHNAWRPSGDRTKCHYLNQCLSS